MFTFYRKTCIYLFALAFIISSVFTSCLTAKNLTYFQKDIPPFESQSNRLSIIPGPSDVVFVQVNSMGSKDSSVKNPFLPLPADLQAPPPANAVGYLIDKNGVLTLPLVGDIVTHDRTTAQIEDSIQIKLQAYLIKPTVFVRLANLRITVLGEVNKPATFTLNYYTVTLPEALGMAGDLTPYARRDNILVIREYNPGEKNKRSYARINLTKTDVFNSPYYYLQPHDVVYVSPTNARAASVDRTYQIMPIILSGITVIATVLSLALK